MRARIPLILIVLILFLTACSQETDLTFYRNESWKVQTSIRYDEDLIDLFGGVLGMVVGAELGIPVPLSNMSDALGLLGLMFDMAKPEFRARGIDFTWQKINEAFVLDFRGEAISTFNQMLPQTAQIENLGNEQYHLAMVFLGLGDLDPSLALLETYTGAMFQNTVTLHAGRIISSNADEIRGGTAIWYNPDQVDVVFSPKNPFPPIIFWAAGIVIFLSISIAIGSRLRGQRCPMCGARAGRRAGSCPGCGMTLYSDVSSNGQDGFY